MGKLLKFIPRSKPRTADKSHEPDPVKIVKGLREGFTDEEVKRIKKDLESEVEDE